MIFWIWAGVILLIIVLYFRKKYSRFSPYGVKTTQILAPFGNIWKTTFRLQHFSEIMTDLYNKFPDDRFIGQYEFVNPMIVVKDLELIKQITVKDFDTFLDHRFVINQEVDPIFGSNLFALKGQKWKDMRSTLSPAFTSSKIRQMVPFMVEVGNQMIASLKAQLKKKGTDSLEIEIKDLAMRYANDVIATCAFGIKVDSMANNDNEFFTMGKNTANFTFWQMLKFFGYTSIPNVMNKLKVKMFSDEIDTFFTQLVLTTMENREKNNVIRPDMIHLLMEAKKGNLTYDRITEDEDAGFATVEESSVGKTTVKRTWLDTDLIAQAVLFFIAGFDGVATVMTFLLYELAVNPDCQEKLLEEIKETEKMNKGFNYNSVQEMKYLDMLVCELLRKWPPAIAADRVALKAYNLGKANSKSTQDYIVQKGEGIWIPIWPIHHDPNYYENPSKFDPERFSDENKHKIKPFTYMPFGNGPRNCIGSRFALCEVKVMVYQLIQHMEILPSEKTCIPPQLSTDTFNLRMKTGHWLTIKPRK